MRDSAVDTRRILAILFVAGQIGIFAFLQLGIPGASFAGVLLIGGTLWNLRLGASKPTQLRPYMHTILLFGIGAVYLSLGFMRMVAGRELIELFVLFAEFLLITQSLEIVRNRENVAIFLPGLGTLTLVMIVLGISTPINPRTLENIYVLFCLCLILMLRSDLLGMAFGNRALRNKALTILFLVLMTLGSGRLFQSELRRDLSDLRQFLNTVQFGDQGARIFDTSQANFVREVGFNNIASTKRTDPAAPVFQIQVQEGLLWRAPGYTRTLSFESFDGTLWSNPSDFPSRMLDSSSQPGIGRAGNVGDFDNRTFQLRDPYSEPLRHYEIEVPYGRGRLVPIPVGTAFVRGRPTRKSRLEVDSHFNPAAGSLLNRKYETFTDDLSLASQFDASYFARLLQIPESEQGFLLQQSQAMVGDAKSVSAKVKAIENYLCSNFKYSLDTEPGRDLRGRSELRAFLEDRREAHCEYFATAATLLLRSQGIPTRLSTGYLVYEFNDEVDAYVARNRDAHAWAEAYDTDSNSWLVVEPTPGTAEFIAMFDSATTKKFGMSENRLENAATGFNLLDFFQSLASRVKGWLTTQFEQRYAWIYPLIALMIVVAGQAIVRVRRSQDKSFVSLTVRRADRKAKRLGLKRAPFETCHQFSRRLMENDSPKLIELGQWYLEFANQRYASE